MDPTVSADIRGRRLSAGRFRPSDLVDGNVRRNATSEVVELEADAAVLRESTQSRHRAEPPDLVPESDSSPSSGGLQPDRGAVADDGAHGLA